MRPWIRPITLIGAAACTEETPPQALREMEPMSATRTEGATVGFVLKTGEGEPLLNGIVVKASPKTGTLGPFLAEQTFQRGYTTNLHTHQQGDELFYVVSGRGTATLDDETEAIEPGDVIFVPQSAVHRIANLDNDEPLRVVYFMDSPELVEQFRALHERVTSEPDRPITPEERAAIEERTGGSTAVR